MGKVIDRIRQWFRRKPAPWRLYKFELVQIGVGVVGHMEVRAPDPINARVGAIMATPPGLVIGPAMEVTSSGDTVH